MNNVLHHQLYNILNFILESNKKEVIEFFFTKNEKFLCILQKIVNESQDIIHNRDLVTAGFVGYFKLLTKKLRNMYIEDEAFLNNKTWNNFLREFLDVELEKEKEIFTDIDINQSDNCEKTIPFDFSIEAIQLMYTEFLGLNEVSATVVDQHENHEEEENEEEENKEVIKETLHKPSPHIDSEALREELKKMDLINQEETAYQDSRYWKPKMDYEVDVLLSELHMS
jgi:hypothetical protein